MRAHVPPDARVVLRSRRGATSRSTHASHSAYDANAGGAPARGSSASTGARFDAIPVSSPANHGEFADSASTTGSHGSDRLEAAPAVLGRRHADVHVQPLHALPAHGDAAVADERHVALLLDDRLRLRARERVRRRRRDREALRAAAAAAARRSAGSARVDLAAVDAQTSVFVSKTDANSSVFTRPGSSSPSTPREDPVDRGDLLERLRVEDHQLLLDAERERRRLAEARSGSHAP